MALELVELSRKRRAESPEERYQRMRHAGNSGVAKRRRRRNMKMRDDLKFRGRHRGFSHGKA